MKVELINDLFDLFLACPVHKHKAEKSILKSVSSHKKVIMLTAEICYELWGC